MFPDIKPEETPTFLIYPPEEVFRNYTPPTPGVAGKTQTSQTLPGTIACSFPETGGMWLWLEGNKYPKQGWPYRSLIVAIDACKSALIGMVELISSRPLRYFVPFFLFLPRKMKRQVFFAGIAFYSKLSARMLNRHWLKEKFLCPVAREVNRVGQSFCENDTQRNFVDMFVMILEGDDAYRYRIQDALENLNKESFYKNPGEEMRRIISLMHNREYHKGGVAKSLERVGLLLNILFRIKDIREFAFAFVKELDLEKVKLNENDWYQCLIWVGYDFRGVSLADRLAERDKIDSDPSIKFIEERMMEGNTKI